MDGQAVKNKSDGTPNQRAVACLLRLLAVDVDVVLGEVLVIERLVGAVAADDGIAFVEFGQVARPVRRRERQVANGIQFRQRHATIAPGATPSCTITSYAVRLEWLV